MSHRNAQTEFSLEEPLFEQVGQIPADPEPEDPESVDRLVWYKRKKLVAVIIFVATIVILALLFVINQIIMQGKLPSIVDLQDLNTPTVDRTGHPLMQRIIAAERELVAADPTKRELGYPTLNYEIELDPTRR
ncbi:MAG: hypothetical protein WDZ94_00375 [Patescibacteria group bacterium]